MTPMTARTAFSDTLPVAADPDDMTAVQDDGSAVAPADMTVQAQAASNFLKALAHEGRLMILCHLSTGEKTVTELEHLLASRQAAVSQQLARLRLEGIVSCRRDGKAIYYALHDPRAARVVSLMYDMFCKDATAAQ